MASCIEIEPIPTAAADKPAATRPQSAHSWTVLIAAALFALQACGAEDRTSSTTSALTTSTAESLGQPSGTFLILRPAIASWAVGQLSVFATGNDHNLYVKTYQSNTWGSWLSLNAPNGGSSLKVVSSPAAVSWGPNRTDVFVIAAPITNDPPTSGTLYHVWYDGTWHAWEAIGPALALTFHGPGAASTSANNLDVFATDTTGTIRQLSFSTLFGWGTIWKTVGGATTSSDLSVVSWGNGRFDLVGASGSNVDHRWYPLGMTTTWGTETLSVGNNLVGVPTVSSRGYGLLDILFEAWGGSLDRMVYDVQWPPGGVDATTGTIPNSPAAVSWGPGRTDVVWLDSVGGISHEVLGTLPVATQHNDIRRSGGKTDEVELNANNVNLKHFGLRFRVDLDGDIYGQPLYASNVAVPTMGVHNVVYVATTNNTIYMIDADDPTQDARIQSPPTPPLHSWNYGMLTPPLYPVLLPQADMSVPNCAPPNLWESGIVGTPVLDLAQHVLFFVTFSSSVALARQSSMSCGAQPAHTYQHILHAVDSTTLAEIANVPISPSSGPVFESGTQLQRAALLELNGRIYVAFGAYGDRPKDRTASQTGTPFHGWIIEYSYVSSAFTRLSSFSTTAQDIPDAGANDLYNCGGIWQSGQGPASDGTSIFLEVGNGLYDGANSWGDSVLRLSVNPLQRQDSFTPTNQVDLRNYDLDIGSSGVTLLPTTPTRVVAGSKLGVMWSLDATSLGGYQPGTSIETVPSFVATEENNSCPSHNLGAYSNIHGSPVYWMNASNQPSVFVWGEEDYVRSYRLDPTTGLPPSSTATTNCAMLDSSPYTAPYFPPGCPLGTNGTDPPNVALVGQYPFYQPASASRQSTTDSASVTVRASCGMPGGMLSLSSNSTVDGTLVVWGVTPSPGAATALSSSVPGTLYAFDGRNLAHLLWSSDPPTCGVAGSPCCTGSTCQTGLTCSGGTCSAGSSCGGPWQPCCSVTPCNGDAFCTNNVCDPNALGLFGKFVAPTVADGSVFMVTHTSDPGCSVGCQPHAQLVVYGPIASTRYSP